LTFILSLAAPAQETEKWTKTASPKGDFIAQLPPDFLVDNEDDAYRVYAFHNEATMRILIDEASDAKSRLKMLRQVSGAREARVTQFDIGGFSGKMYTYEREKSISVSIYLASSKAFITVSAWAKEESNAELKNFLYSIRANNQALFKNPPLINQDAEEPISVAALRTSPIVLSMLKIKDAEKTPVKYALEDPKKKKDDEEEGDDDNADKYSRPLITLRKPRASYTDTARGNNVQGIVRLKIVFRSDARIGGITVLQKLDGSLTAEAVNAVRKIKFVPAEIDGKAVDVARVVVYTFTLY
jgi:hypothetical protein